MRLAWKSWLRRESRLLIIITGSTGLLRACRNNSVWPDQTPWRASEIDYHNEQLYALANIRAERRVLFSRARRSVRFRCKRNYVKQSRGKK